MSDTLPNVVLPANTPVDLYAASGIAVGTQISVQNITTSDVRVYSGATSPDVGSSGSTLLRPGITAKNESGDAGAWAWSTSGAAVNVKEVV